MTMLLFRRYYKTYFKEFDSFYQANEYMFINETAGEIYPIAIIDNADGNILWHRGLVEIEEINVMKLQAMKYD